MIELLAWGSGAAACLVLWGEIVHWRASRDLTNPDPGGPEVVVVFGYTNRHPDRVNALNRWRVRAALRSVDLAAPSSRLVVCGGSRDCEGKSEAALMAEYARKRGFAGEVSFDEDSRSTWENVANTIPLIEGSQRIKFVSNPLHARKARLYLHRQRPDLACRLVVSADYKPGEWAPLKPLFAAYGLLERTGDRHWVKRSQATAP